jgi:hypothetical protein
MRIAFLVLFAFMLCVATFGIGDYAGVKRTWQVPQLRRLIINGTNP